jgi:hypothetical protein
VSRNANAFTESPTHELTFNAWTLSNRKALQDT